MNGSKKVNPTSIAETATFPTLCCDLSNSNVEHERVPINRDSEMWVDESEHTHWITRFDESELYTSRFQKLRFFKSLETGRE